eukprot:scaffold23819_cov43-Cyclotella_meneghiniana.AAC.2
MRLEFIVTKGLHKLTFESWSWVGKSWLGLTPLSAPRLCVLGSYYCHITAIPTGIHPANYDKDSTKYTVLSSSTISHYIYDYNPNRCA